jgi:hypothetical protein
VGPVRLELGSRAGGIVFVRAGLLTVGASGSIKAGGSNQDCRTANTGGSIMLRGETLDLGSQLVSAAGAVTEKLVAGCVSAPATIAASPGYISVFFKTSLTGTTDPAAFSLQMSDP